MRTIRELDGFSMEKEGKKEVRVDECSKVVRLKDTENW